MKSLRHGFLYPRSVGGAGEHLSDRYQLEGKKRCQTSGLTQAELLFNKDETVWLGSVKKSEQTLPAGDDQSQSVPRADVFLMREQMAFELLDTIGEQGDLHIR